MVLRACAFACLLPLAALADPAPKLGVASNFSQGWQPDTLEMSRQLPALDFRDGLRWRVVEKPDGSFVYADPRTTYPAQLEAIGAGLSLTVNSGHPSHDDDKTPITPQGRAAFAQFAARTVERYPNIHSVEVGNEMNSRTFASGPGWDGTLRERARSYAALLAATAKAVRAVRPEVKILGGAAHSVPLPWFEEIFAAGGADHMDALVIHPYTTEPEQLVRMIALLRDLPQAADMPIEVTEWGSPERDAAPTHLLKGYCQFALAGVTRFIWYPLNPRGDGLIPLLGHDGPTPTGDAYALAVAQFEGREVSDLGVDPFTYGCGFGERAMVLWGAPRDVTLADGVRALAPDGRALAPGGLRLSRDAPLVLLSDAPMALGVEVQLGAHGVIADSFDQFAYPGAQARGPFTLLAEAGDRLVPYETRPGQERGGVPWSPYLGNPLGGSLFATAGSVLPRLVSVGGLTAPATVVQRYRSGQSGPARVEIDIAPSPRSTDGVVLQLRQRGEILLERVVTDPQVVTLDVALTKGLDTDVLVSPGNSDEGDLVRLRTRYLGAD